MTRDPMHVFATLGNVSVHDDDRCWCSQLTAEEAAAMAKPDLLYLLEAARGRNLAAQGLARPTERRPIDGDRDE